MKVHIQCRTPGLFLGSSILPVNFQGALRFDMMGVSSVVALVFILEHKDLFVETGRNQSLVWELIKSILTRHLILVPLPIISQNWSSVVGLIWSQGLVFVHQMIQHLLFAILNLRQGTFDGVFVVNSLVVLLYTRRNIWFNAMEWGALRLDFNFFFLCVLWRLLDLFHAYLVLADVSPGIQFLDLASIWDTILITTDSIRHRNFNRRSFLRYIHGRGNTFPVITFATLLIPLVLMSPFFSLCINERKLLALQILIARLILDCLPMFCKRLDHLAPFHTISTFVGQDSCSKNLFGRSNIIAYWDYIFVDAFSF